MLNNLVKHCGEENNICIMYFTHKPVSNLQKKDTTSSSLYYCALSWDSSTRALLRLWMFLITNSEHVLLDEVKPAKASFSTLHGLYVVWYALMKTLFHRWSTLKLPVPLWRPPNRSMPLNITCKNQLQWSISPPGGAVMEAEALLQLLNS